MSPTHESEIKMEDTKCTRKATDRRSPRTCKKECAIIVEVGDNRKVSAYTMITSLEKEDYDILAVIPQGTNSYEITLGSDREAKRLANEGIVGEDIIYDCRLLFNDSTVVSFFELPAYISDEDLKIKLRNKGIELLGPVIKNCYKGTDVYNGTRHVRCKFPPNYASLPYSMKFETVQGPKYYKVKHNNQCKICFHCDSPDHVLKDCPNVQCYRCNGHGHTSKTCPEPPRYGQRTPKCDICNLDRDICDCFKDYEEGVEDDDSDDMTERSRTAEAPRQAGQDGNAPEADSQETVEKDKPREMMPVSEKIGDTGSADVEEAAQYGTQKSTRQNENDEDDNMTQKEDDTTSTKQASQSGHASEAENQNSVKNHLPLEMTPVPTRIRDTKRANVKRNKPASEGYTTAETKKQRRFREMKSRENNSSKEKDDGDRECSGDDISK